MQRTRQYAHRADAFQEIRSQLPAEASVLGLLTDGSESTASWWKPFGARRCVYLLTPDAVAEARKAGIHYVALRDSNCQRYFKMTVAQWLVDFRGEALGSFEIRIAAAAPPERYTLVKLLP